MKNHVVTFLLACMLISVVLSGCSSSSKDNNSPKQTSAISDDKTNNKKVSDDKSDVFSGSSNLSNSSNSALSTPEKCVVAFVDSLKISRKKDWISYTIYNKDLTTKYLDQTISDDDIFDGDCREFFTRELPEWEAAGITLSCKINSKKNLTKNDEDFAFICEFYEDEGLDYHISDIAMVNFDFIGKLGNESETETFDAYLINVDGNWYIEAISLEVFFNKLA